MDGWRLGRVVRCRPPKACRPTSHNQRPRRTAARKSPVPLARATQKRRPASPATSPSQRRKRRGSALPGKDAASARPSRGAGAALPPQPFCGAANARIHCRTRNGQGASATRVSLGLPQCTKQVRSAGSVKLASARPTRLVALAKGYGMVPKLWVQRSMMGHRLQPT